MVKTTTSWNNTSATANLENGESIKEAISDAIGSLPADRSGKLQVALRFQKNDVIDINAGEDITSKISELFDGIITPKGMTMVIDFNIIAETELDELTDAEAKELITNCVQFINKESVSETTQSSVIVIPSRLKPISEEPIKEEIGRL